jgi:predicted DNA-binding transcriptional regulator AlpA
MSEEELSYCIVHLGFPLPRPVGEGGLHWAAWEVDRWMRSQGERTAA